MLAGTGASLPKELRGASATVTRAPAADGKVTVQISGGATFVVASSDIRCSACACCASASEMCCDLSACSLVPDGNSENVAVLLQEVQGSIPKLKQASDARSLCPLSLYL